MYTPFDGNDYPYDDKMTVESGGSYNI